MDSGRLLKYAYRAGTQPSERNLMHTLQLKEYLIMINRLNRENQSLSMNMVDLIKENALLKRQLHQKKISQIVGRQLSSQLKSTNNYVSRYNKSCNKSPNKQINDPRKKQGEHRPNNSVYVGVNKNKQAKFSSVLKSPTIIQELSQQKFYTQRKKGLYLSKQISQASDSNKKQEKLSPVVQSEKKQEKQVNPQSNHKQNNIATNKTEQAKIKQASFKKTNSPYKMELKKTNYGNTSGFSTRKDHLESMYSYLYSPIKTYNGIVYDKI